MRTGGRHAIAPAVAVALLVLMPACGSDENDPSQGEAGAASSSTAGDAAANGRDDGAAAESGTVIEVVVADGEVVGGVERVEVGVGGEVILRVRSDVADEVHLHGYEIRVDIEADGSADLRFTAEFPGVFEAELERLHLKLVELEVRS